VPVIGRGDPDHQPVGAVGADEHAAVAAVERPPAPAVVEHRLTNRGMLGWL